MSQSSNGREFTADDVADMLSNPVYTGIGPYPQIIDEEKWIAVGAIRIADVGAEEYLRRMLRVLRSSLEGARMDFGE